MTEPTTDTPDRDMTDTRSSDTGAIQNALEIRGVRKVFTAGLLRRAAQALVDRHDVLRTAFV